MKSTGLLLALFLLSASTLYPPSAAAKPVTDVDGEVVENGGTYYILPAAIWGWSGGIELAATGNETCPLSVVQSPSEVSKGLPLKISSPFRTHFLPEGRVFIEFVSVPICAPSPSLWTVVQGLPEGPAVKITGYENTASGAFSIHRATLENSYKLLFRADDDSGVSGAVGIFFDSDGTRRLVVTDESNAFQFYLQKVASSSAASQ